MESEIPTIETQPRVLVRCSSADEEENVNKKKKSKINGEEFSSLEPLITTVTKTTTTTTSITIITPPEDPNNHIDLYLCIKPDIDAFSWLKIDPTNNNQKNKKQQKRILLTPISHMPPTTPRGFRAIPHSSPEKKLVYALGGSTYSTLGRSSKALVCDFASNNYNPIWEELPPMPSPLHICIGVASPSNGNVYAFGVIGPEEPPDPEEYMGVVFDPSSSSWNPCPHPFKIRIQYDISVEDTALVHTEDNQSEFVAFTSTHGHTFNLATAKWERSFYASPPDPPPGSCSSSTSLGVGDLIFKFRNHKLYALDFSSPKPSFDPVPGLDNKVPKYWETAGSGRMVYLGKGKLCIVWGRSPAEKTPTPTLYITCLKFWVGMCNRRNRLRAVIDRCERFVAHGIQLYDVVAL